MSELETSLSDNVTDIAHLCILDPGIGFHVSTGHCDRLHVDADQARSSASVAVRESVWGGGAIDSAPTGIALSVSDGTETSAVATLTLLGFEQGVRQDLDVQA